MAATGTLTIVASIGGVTLQKTINKSADHPNIYGDANTDIPLLAGKAVTAWVKTDADTAACDLPAGHGYTNGQFDVYWTGGMRYDVAGTIETNALALDGGSGTDFPESAAEDVIVCKHQQINTAIDGDEIALLAIMATKRAHLHFEDAAAGVVADMELNADEPQTWHDGSSIANPLTGNPITVCFATTGTAAAAVLTILSLEDSTP